MRARPTAFGAVAGALALVLVLLLQGECGAVEVVNSNRIRSRLPNRLKQQRSVLNAVASGSRDHVLQPLPSELLELHGDDLQVPGDDLRALASASASASARSAMPVLPPLPPAPGMTQGKGENMKDAAYAAWIADPEWKWGTNSVADLHAKYLTLARALYSDPAPAPGAAVAAAAAAARYVYALPAPPACNDIADGTGFCLAAYETDAAARFGGAAADPRIGRLRRTRFRPGYQGSDSPGGGFVLPVMVALIGVTDALHSCNYWPDGVKHDLDKRDQVRSVISGHAINHKLGYSAANDWVDQSPANFFPQSLVSNTASAWADLEMIVKELVPLTQRGTPIQLHANYKEHSKEDLQLMHNARAISAAGEWEEHKGIEPVPHAYVQVEQSFTYVDDTNGAHNGVGAAVFTNTAAGKRHPTTNSYLPLGGSWRITASHALHQLLLTMVAANSAKYARASGVLPYEISHPLGMFIAESARLFTETWIARRPHEAVDRACAKSVMEHPDLWTFVGGWSNTDEFRDHNNPLYARWMPRMSQVTTAQYQAATGSTRNYAVAELTRDEQNQRVWMTYVHTDLMNTPYYQWLRKA